MGLIKFKIGWILNESAIIFQKNQLHYVVVEEKHS